MSYTSGNAGGTTWGAKTFNQIFAPNSETVGAAEYWDKSQVEDYDTVVCSTNSKVLTAKYLNRSQADGTQVLHWFGTGVYLCEVVLSSANSVQMGDYVLCSDSGGVSVRPYVEVRDGSGDEEYAFGTVLVGGVDNDFITVATLGNWPVRRSGSVSLNTHAIQSSTAKRVSTGGNADGAMGKFYVADFDIIRDANAVPTVAFGGILTMWGRTEVY